MSRPSSGARAGAQGVPGGEAGAVTTGAARDSRQPALPPNQGGEGRGKGVFLTAGMWDVSYSAYCLALPRKPVLVPSSMVRLVIC